MATRRDCSVITKKTRYPPEPRQRQYLDGEQVARRQALPVCLQGPILFTQIVGSIRVSQRYFGAFRGFSWMI